MYIRVKLSIHFYLFQCHRNVKLEAILSIFIDVEESCSSIGKVHGVVQEVQNWFTSILNLSRESVSRFEVRMSLPRYYRCAIIMYIRYRMSIQTLIFFNVIGMSSLRRSLSSLWMSRSRVVAFGKVRGVVQSVSKLIYKYSESVPSSRLEWVFLDTIGCLRTMYIRNRMSIPSLSFSMSKECQVWGVLFQIYGCREIP